VPGRALARSAADALGALARRLHIPWLAGATLQLQQAQLQQLPPRHLAELLIAMAHFALLPPPAWLLAYQRAAQLQLAAYSASDLAVCLAAASQLKLRAMELVLATDWLLALIREVQARVSGPWGPGRAPRARAAGGEARLCCGWPAPAQRRP
jgi:hypothetical protein